MSAEQLVAVLARIADAVERIATGLHPVAIQTDVPTPADGPTLAELKLTTRTRHALSQGNKYREPYNEPPPNTLSDIAKWRRSELLRIANFGHASYIEVWRLCVEHGYWSANDETRLPDIRRLREIEAKERAGKWRPPRSAAA